MNVGRISYSSSIALSQAGSHVQTQKTASPTAAIIMLRQVPGFSSLNSLMQDSYHRLVFKDICYPWFSNTHAFSEASSQCFPKISLNSFTHQHPPQGRKKNAWSGTYLCTFCIWQSDMERADLHSDRIHR